MQLMAAEQLGGETSAFSGQHSPGQALRFNVATPAASGVGAMQRQPSLTITGDGLLADSIEGLGELRLGPSQLLQAGSQREA